MSFQRISKGIIKHGYSLIFVIGVLQNKKSQRMKSQKSNIISKSMDA
jgi:hypothetical protein